MKLFNEINTKKLLLGLTLFLLSFQSWAQKNPNIPRPRGPVDLTETSNLVIFIVIPAVIVIFYFVWRSEMKKRKKREEEKNNFNK